MEKTDISMRSWIIFFLTVLALGGVVFLTVVMWTNRVQPTQDKINKSILELNEESGKATTALHDEGDRILENLRTSFDGAVEKRQEQLKAGLDAKVHACEARLESMMDAASDLGGIQKAVQGAETQRAALEKRVKELEARLGELVASETEPAVDIAAEARRAAAGTAKDEVKALESRLMATLDRKILDVLPVGTILPWDSREIRNGRPTGVRRRPPEGWSYCNGSDYPLDLRGRFLRGADSSRPVGASGGMNEVPAAGAHTHHALGSDPRAREGRNYLVRVWGVPAQPTTPVQSNEYYVFYEDGLHTHPYFEPRNVNVEFIVKVR